MPNTDVVRAIQLSKGGGTYPLFISLGFPDFHPTLYGYIPLLERGVRTSASLFHLPKGYVKGVCTTAPLEAVQVYWISSLRVKQVHVCMKVCQALLRKTLEEVISERVTRCTSRCSKHTQMKALVCSSLTSFKKEVPKQRSNPDPEYMETHTHTLSWDCYQKTNWNSRQSCSNQWDRRQVASISRPRLDRRRCLLHARPG